MSLWAFGFTPHVISAGGRAVHRLHVVFPMFADSGQAASKRDSRFYLRVPQRGATEIPVKKKIRRMKFSQLKLRKHKIPCDETYWTMQKAVWFLEILLCMDRPFDVFTSASDGTRLMGKHAKPWQKRLFGRNPFVPSPGLQSFTLKGWWIFKGNSSIDQEYGEQMIAIYIYINYGFFWCWKQSWFWGQHVPFVQVPFEGLTMVHLDAHPDLSASTTMAAQLIMEEPHQVASWLSALHVLCLRH